MAKRGTARELARSKEFNRIEKEMRVAYELCGSSMTRFCVLVAEYMGLAVSKTDRTFFVTNLMHEYDMDKAAVYRAERCGKASKALESGQGWPQLPANDSQLRPLALLLDRGEKVIGKAWGKALEIAEEADEPVTAAVVQEAVDAYLPIVAVTRPSGGSLTTEEKAVKRSVRALEKIVRELYQYQRTKGLAARLDLVRVDIAELAAHGQN